ARTDNAFAGLQESSVHTLPSSQLTAVPAQVPFEHVSLLVQAFPSVQGAEFGVCRQPRPGSQLSFVHGFPSSQLTAHDGAQSIVVISSDQLRSVPVSPPASSASVIVQTPFGSSSMKAPSASCGVSVGTGVSST